MAKAAAPEPLFAHPSSDAATRPSEIRLVDDILSSGATNSCATQVAEIVGKLEAVRAEANAAFEAQERELTSQFTEIVRVGALADTNATLLTLFTGLGSLARGAYQSLGLSGTALSRANKELAREVAQSTGLMVAEAAAPAVADSGGDADGVSWLLGKALAQAFADMTSPSYWANAASMWVNDDSLSCAANCLSTDSLARIGGSLSRALTARPSDTLAAARARVAAMREQSNVMIDARISSLQAQRGRCR